MKRPLISKNVMKNWYKNKNKKHATTLTNPSVGKEWEKYSCKIR